MGRLFRAGESIGERSDRVGGSGGGYNWIEAGEEVKLANVGENGIFEQRVVRGIGRRGYIAVRKRGIA